MNTQPEHLDPHAAIEARDPDPTERLPHESYPEAIARLRAMLPMNGKVTHELDLQEPA